MIYSHAFNDWFAGAGFHDESKERWAEIWNRALVGTTNPSALLTEILEAARQVK